MINPDSPIPLYFQLARDLEEMIDAGKLKKGTRIPSENDLSRYNGIGRPTVRQALDVLQRKGLIRKEKGSGTFVSGPAKAVNLFSLAGTSAAFLEKGIIIGRKIVKGLELSVPREEDNPLNGIRVYRLKRLSTVGGEPVLFEDIFMSERLFRGLEKYDLGGQPLSRIIEKEFFLKPAGGRQSFGVKLTGEEEASLLGLAAGEPVLSVKRELYFRQDKKCFYSELLCRTDRFVFYQDLGSEI
jgi:GntR family transcriptional regulator